MDPGQPDNKRPRLSTTNSWSPTGAPQHHLPPLHPPSSLPPTPHQAHQPHHTAPPGPYHQQPPPYPPRSAEPHHPPHPAQHHPDDRRHHDQDPPYAPMQDHYRPPPSPSPAHPSYNPFPPRDPGSVKREPHDESLSHPRRPHSTGGGPSDGLPPPPPPPHPHNPAPPHSAPPPPPQYSEDPRRPPHMTYDNAPPQMPPTPGGYRGSYPPPPIPQQPPQQYEQPPYHPQPPPDSVYSISYSTQKRKATRASQACDSCRQLKAKCDETKPCKSCREKGVECKYRDPIPKAIDKSQTDILESLSELKGLIQTKFGAVEQRLDRLERTHQLKDIKVENDVSASSPSPPTAKSLSSPEENFQPAQEAIHHEEPAPMAVGETDLSHPSQDEEMADTEDQDDDKPPGPAVAPDAPSIPVNHTTPAGLLLAWPAIKELTQRTLAAEGVKYIEEFPLSQEQNRGLLRLYGRGEGSGHIHEKSGSTPYNPAVIAEQYGSLDTAEDSYSETGASPSPGEAWGQVGSLSPPSLGYSSNTLTADGTPDFSEAKVRAYVKSFEESILVMHPVLMPSDLKNLVKRFLENIAMGDKRGKTSNPGVARFAPPAPPMHVEMSNKRKRSPGAEQPEEPVHLPRKPGRPHRTIENALVLIILALGKVCLHRTKIPDPPQDKPDNSHSSPMSRNGYPSSPGPGGQASPPSYSSHSQSSGLPSPKEQGGSNSSRRHSLQGAGSKTGGHSMRRNYDCIPGLEYFAIASDILGGHQGGWTIKHAQTFIFAGLYHGQLGRVIESDGYIYTAARALQMIMRRDLDRFQKIQDASKIIETKRDNIVLLTYWTCLQLESDILAELNLPQSAGLSYERKMPWPNISMLESDFPNYVCQGYFGQLFLRKMLNKLHSILYDPSVNEPPMEKFQKALDVEQTLRSFSWVGKAYMFGEDDPPANNILEARMRAKFWGTQTIIYRPIIKMVLDISERLKQQPDTVDTTGGLGLFSHGDATNFVGHGVGGYDELGEEIIEYVKRGIRALVRSTQAFHGVDKERLLVTNIFGTAHAQWGNLLILAAAYRDNFLRQFVDGPQLHYLFHRTIKMFQMHAQATSALTIDMRILESVERELFGDALPPATDPGMPPNFSTTPSLSGPTIPPPPPPAPVPAHQGPMSMAYAMEPNSANNSPNQGHRMLNHGVNHTQNHAQPYHGQATPM